MNKNAEDTAHNLLKALNNETTQSKVAEVKSVNQVEALRTEIFEFFKERMSRIKTAENLKNKAQEALEAELDRGELSFNQIMTIFTTASRESRNSAEAIISLFKPVPGANSILADSLGNAATKDDYEEVYESMSQEEIRKVDSLYKMIREISRKNNDDVTGSFEEENTDL